MSTSSNTTIGLFPPSSSVTGCQGKCIIKECDRTSSQNEIQIIHLIIYILKESEKKHSTVYYLLLQMKYKFRHLEQTLTIGAAAAITFLPVSKLPVKET